MGFVLNGTQTILKVIQGGKTPSNSLETEQESAEMLGWNYPRITLEH